MTKNQYALGRFRIRVIGWISVIMLVLMGISYAVISAQSILVITFLSFLLVYFLFRLFAYVNKTNRDLTNFLLSIRFDDYETSYTESRAGSDDKETLYAAFNLITDKFRNIRSDKEAQHQFLQLLVEQVETGLLCFDDKGDTILMNRAAQSMLHKSFLPNLTSLKKLNPILYEVIQSYRPGERQLVRVDIDNHALQLAIQGTVLKTSGQTIRLFALQNINSELSQQEIVSWQKLIRILTHEIMNSVSPVVSLASTTEDMIRHTEDFSPSTREQVHKAILAIQKRSESLLSFTQRYRQLLRLPKPALAPCDLSDLLVSLVVLYQPDMTKKQIDLVQNIPSHHIEIEADSSLLEQAFINLLKNAMDALEGRNDPVIEISLFRDRGDVVVQIADNGPGMTDKIKEQIFIPFFTTKPSGSGIGLSLCRQIIVQHGGSLSVSSSPGKGTVFTSRLPLSGPLVEK